MLPPGTPFVSSTFSRVSTVLGRDVVLGNLRRNQEELLRIQEQLATGFKVLRPSDDAIASNRVLDFQLRIRRDEQFVRNIDRGVSRLETSDDALGGMNDLVTKAKTISLQQVQSTATAATRLTAATEVSALLKQAVNLGNTQFEDRYLFGGSRSESTPFLVVGNAVAFGGDVRAFDADVADGLRAQTNVTSDALGVLSDEIRGVDLTPGPTFLQPIDLDPRVSDSTKLSALNRGEGVRLGSIQVTGTGTATIDLRIAETVGDVRDLINAQTGTTGVSVLGFNPALNGLQLTSVAPITVQEVGNGVTALDLGIQVTGAVSPFDGGDLDPNVIEETLIGDLRGGLGLDPAGVAITNATSGSSFSATVAPGSTVGDLLNNLNTANVYVDARISSTGRGIDVLSRLSGGRLTIAENGGATANQLGLLSTLAHAGIEDLNGGQGVGSADGLDIKITKKDGTVAYFDVDNATSVQALVDAIDNTAGLDATITGAGLNQIEITDTTVGAPTFTIVNFNGSYAATNLGIAGTAAATITGTPLTFDGVQPVGLFTGLIRLRDALLANDTIGINQAARLLEQAQKKVLTARADAGARTASMELTKNRLENEKLELKKLMSDSRDADLAEVATQFQIQQTVLEASLAVASRILQTSLFNYL
ncbi:MAG: hypothetical protein HYY17_00915 [Planctomycetes bacterium]|nr:hypothetical protein [Planctomycetota bacterium]